MTNQWIHKIFTVTPENFEATALEVFRFQQARNPLYARYIDLVRGARPVTSIADIPFLPLNFFKSHAVKTTDFSEQAVFESSGTTGMTSSRHFIKELEIYRESFMRCFAANYGAAEEWCILGLLPNYLERGQSSLVYMVKELIDASKHPMSGFYLSDFERLASTIAELERRAQKTLLLGVSYALLDFSERFPLPLKNTIVMETGGMKGRRREMLREELHAILQSRFGVAAIHSEYGMTELLSQAYSAGGGIFRCPPWMKILLRDEEDPFEVFGKPGFRKGAINIADLANIYSCAFLATADAGEFCSDGFRVLGRLDNSDIRGCSLLAV